MKKLIRIFYVALACCVAAGAVSAQAPLPVQTPPPSAEDDREVVKISTNLIQFDVTVTNKKGEQATGLTLDDFEVYENGKKQNVANVTYVSVNSRAVPESKRKTEPGAGQTVAAPPVFKPLEANQVRRTVALLVDDMTTSFGGIQMVKAALKNYVNNQMQPNDLVAILSASGGSGMFQQFTSDKRILLAAISKIKPNTAKINSFAQLTNISTETENSTYIAQRDSYYARSALGAVNQLVNYLDKMPGRKAVILFSEGFVLFSSANRTISNNDRPNGSDNRIDTPDERNDARNNTRIDSNSDTSAIFSRLGDATRELLENANRAGVVINTVDTRGLSVIMAEAGDGTTFLRSANSLRNGSRVAAELAAIVQARNQKLFDTQSSLKMLADETGGRAFLNNNGLDDAIREAVEDQNGYYLLSYEPEDELFDPQNLKFNKVEIKLKNRPELRLKYRSGFINLADSKFDGSNKSKPQGLLESLFSPFNANDIEINLTPVYFSDAKSSDSLSALISISGQDLVFSREANGERKSEFEILAFTVDSGGKLVDKVAKTYSLSLNEEKYGKLMEKGLVYLMDIPVKKPGGYQLKIALRDTKNGKVGSAGRFVEVPDRKSENLVLSGILLQNFTPAELKAKTSVSGEDNRLQADTAVREFKAGTYLSYVFEIYNSKNNGGQPLQLQSQVQLYYGDKLLMQGPNEPLAAQGGGQKTQAQGLISLGKDLAPGNYALQIVVTNPAAKEKERTVTQFIDFEIVGG